MPGFPPVSYYSINIDLFQHLKLENLLLHNIMTTACSFPRTHYGPLINNAIRTYYHRPLWVTPLGKKVIEMYSA
jgi:hypothetical protein